MTELDIGYTSVSDLSPLKGMPLSRLKCSGVGVTDLSPLARFALAKLEHRRNADCGFVASGGNETDGFGLRDTLVADLSPLVGMSTLTGLKATHTKVTPDGVADLQKALPGCKIESDDPAKPTAPK